MKSTNQPSGESNQFDNNTAKTNNSTAKTLVAIAAGAAAGAVTAMLLTPKTGAETRQALAKSANQLKGTMSDTLKQGIDKLSGKVDQAMSGAGQLKDDAMSAMKQGAKNAGETASNIAGHAKENISDTVKQSYDKLGAKVSEIAKGYNS